MNILKKSDSVIKRMSCLHLFRLERRLLLLLFLLLFLFLQPNDLHSKLMQCKILTGNVEGKTLSFSLTVVHYLHVFFLLNWYEKWTKWKAKAKTKRMKEKRKKNEHGRNSPTKIPNRNGAVELCNYHFIWKVEHEMNDVHLTTVRKIASMVACITFTRKPKQ